MNIFLFAGHTDTTRSGDPETLWTQTEPGHRNISGEPLGRGWLGSTYGRHAHGLGQHESWQSVHDEIQDRYVRLACSSQSYEGTRHWSVDLLEIDPDALSRLLQDPYVNVQGVPRDYTPALEDLVALRKGLGLSQVQAARRLGLADNYINKIENGAVAFRPLYYWALRERGA